MIRVGFSCADGFQAVHCPAKQPVFFFFSEIAGYPMKLKEFRIALSLQRMSCFRATVFMKDVSK